MKTLLLFAFFCIFSSIAFSQTKVSGTIKGANGELIKGANIVIKDTYDGTSSDSVGHFSFITSEKGSQLIQYSFLGFNSDSLAVNLAGTPISMELVLKEKLNELNTVVISAGSFEASDSKKGVFLNSLDIATTAGTEADVYAALQTLPGTQSASGESGLFVRGGSASETKTFFDGMYVKNPFGAQLPDLASRARFSPFMFKGTTFSAGGYSAQYGQALSSALILESKDLPEKTTTGVNIMTVGAGLDHTAKFKNSALTVSGTYINLKPAFLLFKQRADYDKEPEQYGTSLHYKLKTSPTGMFKLYGEMSNSKVGLFTNNLNNPVQENHFSNHNNNVYLNSTFQDYLNDKWKIQGGASFSNNYDEGDVNIKDNYTRTDRLLQSRITLTNYYGTLSTLRFGAETGIFKRKEGFNNLNRGFDDVSSAVYAESDIFLTQRIVARVGLRGEYSSYSNKYNVAPRTSLGYKTGKHSQVSFAYGKFYQNPEDEYLEITNKLDFEQADHYLLNYQYMGNSRIFRVEGYFKNYNNLVKTNNNFFNNSGDGYAKGIDLFWRDRKTIKDVDYWISYSFLDTKRNFRDYPASATPSFGGKNTLNVVYKQFFEKLHSQVGATYTYATGRTYFNPNNPVYMGDKTIANQNLSLSVSYLTRVFNQFTVIYTSINNIPGFKNVYGYNYSDNGQNRQAIQPPARRNFFVGMFITIGDNTFVR